ncbi:VOC family protein [Pelagicoccus mobilis]|uniref:VOC family protein n=1 Tax=Pelagicoccus mobilis TaxID=415221 RepID=A0A934VPR6_9BACT|nr:VOC family protein [Pelagicoccus mobilis]MBK1877567.1 VOC family protein [Pelagicoccus mobilis]
MSSINVNAYLVFGGRAEEAIEFYKKAVDADVVMMMRFKESPDPMPGLPEGFEDKVMHATLKLGDSVLMISDGYEEDLEFKGFSLAIAVESESEAERLFGNLAETGTVQMPLTKTFWSPLFGLVKDQFGVDWMIDVKVPEVH